VYVSGGADQSKLYVALVDAESGKELTRSGSLCNSNQFQPQLLHTGHAIGRTVFVRIVDKSSDGWGHINFGGLYTVE
jgi:hypothetical protein